MPLASEILVVDDEEDIRDLISGILTDEGYECRVAGDADANLRRGPTSFGLEVGVEAFGSADVALGGMRVFVAAVQAGVTQRAVAAAVARKLIDHAGNLRGQLIGAHLPVIAEAGAGELGTVQDGRNGMNVEWRLGVIGRNVVGGVGPLRVASGGKSENGESQDPAMVKRGCHAAPRFP